MRFHAGCFFTKTHAQYCHQTAACTDSQTSKKSSQEKQQHKLISFSFIFFNAGDTTAKCCRTREKFLNQQTVRKPRWTRNLNSFSLKCTTQTTFEVRYITNQLCYCGITNGGGMFSENCQTKKGGKLLVVISVKKYSQSVGWKLHFYFQI